MTSTAGALGVIFPPYDEDYGYVTLEAFLSGKPVVTTTDAGGPNEFVVDGVNGRVTAPDPEALGEAIRFLAADARRAAALGDAGLRARAPGHLGRRHRNARASRPMKLDHSDPLPERGDDAAGDAGGPAASVPGIDTIE